jgi:NADH-quinone oxidoreductase subunit J
VISHWVFAGAGLVAVLASVVMVTRRQPVYSAVWLLVAFLSMAVVFLTLSAPFLASIHVLVYTGAILVLFLFVIMLLNLKDEELGQEYPLVARLGVAGGCAALFGALAVPITQDPRMWKEMSALGTTNNPGTVESVGEVMFRTYGFQFELVSVLIIVAMFGAMVLAKKKLWT